MKKELSVLLLLLVISGLVYASPDQKKEFSIPSGEDVIKILDDYDIPEGEIVNKDLKIIGGDLNIAGTVNGEITIIGGDVIIQSTAEINGRLLALGGKVHKSPHALVNGEIIEMNDNKWSFSRDESEDIVYADEEYEEIPEKLFRSTPYLEDGWVRYNRQEGFFLQINFNISSSYIPGATIYGGVGRAFHRNKYYGVIGLEQRLINDNIQFYAEAYSRSHTDDTGLISDKTNSLAAFFIHEDFLDWYFTEGYTGGIKILLPYTAEISVSYTDEDQCFMNTVVDWSMFGGGKEFRPGFQITPGRNVTLGYEFKIGNRYRWKKSKQLTAMAGLSRTQSQDKSDFDYVKDEVQIDAFVPFTQELGFHLNSRYAGIHGEFYGPQHLNYLGGIGSLRGYRWKEFPDEDIVIDGTHSLLVSAELVFERVSVFYERGTTWHFADDSIDDDFIKKYQGYQGRESMGISLGTKDIRVDIIKPVGKGDGRNIALNITFMDFD